MTFLHWKMILITLDWYTAIDLACVIQYFIVNTENQEQFAFFFLLGTAGWFNVYYDHLAI